MARFPRDFAPNASTWPVSPAPSRTHALDGRPQVRDRLSFARTWEEGWPPIPATPEGLAFLAEVDRLAREGVVFEAIPASHRVSHGRVIEGSPGAVDGAGQLGLQLATSGWPTGGTFARGDHLVVDGIQYPLVIAADTAADVNGFVTFDLYTPILDGQSPADGALIRLQGMLHAHLAGAPEWPASPGPVDLFAKMNVRFIEDDAQVVAPWWNWDAVVATWQVTAARSQPYHSVDGVITTQRLPVTDSFPFGTFGWYRQCIEPDRGGGFNRVKAYVADNLAELWSGAVTDADHFGELGKAGIVFLDVLGPNPDGGMGADVQGPFRVYRGKDVYFRGVPHDREVRVVRLAGGVGGIPSARTEVAQNTSGAVKDLVVQTALGPADRVELWSVTGSVLLDTLVPAPPFPPGVWGGDVYGVGTNDQLAHSRSGFYGDDSMLTLANFRLGGSILPNGSGIWTGQAGAIMVFDAMPEVDRLCVQCQVRQHGPDEARPGVAGLVDTAWW